MLKWVGFHWSAIEQGRGDSRWLWQASSSTGARKSFASPPPAVRITFASSVPWRTGDATDDSDVDFLVDLEPGRSLLDVGGLLMDLQDLLGRKVDVATEDGLHWYVHDRILNEAVPL